MLRYGKNNRDGDESTRDEPRRRVGMPPNKKQKQVKQKESCDEQGERPTSRQEAAVFHHRFGPLVEVLPAAAGASAKT